jgi:hypothetical protein
MFSRLSEPLMHQVRWFLTIAWLLVIASLFYDPWSSVLTEPNHPWSLLRLPTGCTQVRDVCINEYPYPLGTTIFWGAAIPWCLGLNYGGGSVRYLFYRRFLAP